MNAKIVHSVAKELSPKELQRLYFLIQKQIGEVKVVAKKNKEPIITPAQSMEDVLNSLNETKKRRFRKLAHKQTHT
jgi:hypothetical protein